MEKSTRSFYIPHKRVQLSFEGTKSLTQQSMSAECDINRIMARFEKTGLIDHVNKFEGNYGDFSEMQDYATSMNQVLAAQEMFASLPSGIRQKFNNSPREFLEYVDKEENHEEMRKLGLMPPLEADTEASETEPALRTIKGQEPLTGPENTSEGDPKPSKTK